MKLQDFVQDKPILETGQLILRPLRKEDVVDLKEWLRDSSVYRYWGKRPGKSDLNPELLFQKPEKPKKSFHWGVVHKQDNKVIGDMWVYLIENDRMAKVAFRLSPAYQGNRFMTEALARVTIFCFEETELQRLWADVHVQNIASYKTLEKAGFKREGLIREGKMVNTYCDYYLYGMTNDQIRLIFQLVNSVAGFPHMVYLLSYDKDIVARALDDVQGYRGAEYLEKIIQVPFDLPPIDKYRVRSILKDELEKIRNIPNSVEVDSAHWEQIFGYCIAPIVTSLRDVKRFCNVLSFSYAAVKSEVDFSDMAGITAIKVFAPTIYEWIYANRMSLAGGYRGGGIALSGVKDYRAEMKRIAERIYPDDPEYMLDALACLFPSFGNRITYASDFQTPAELHQALRIASESKFDLYFSLSLENVKIPKIELDNSLLRMSICDLREYVAKLKEHGDLYEYIIEVERNLSRIPTDRVPVLIDGLAFEHGYIDGEKPLVGANKAVFRTRCVFELLMKIENEQERYRIIETILCYTDIGSFDEMTALMVSVERNYKNTCENTGARLVDENEIDVCRRRPVLS